jgi:2-iminobutanoate/2-iminopropanoate deaminase
MRTVSSPPQTTDGAYADAKEVIGQRRILYISGQVPETPEGYVPQDFEDQARLVFKNIRALLTSAGMELRNLVKITIYLSDRKYRSTLATVRNEILAGHEVALTIVIAGIYEPGWLLEIEAVAAD